MLLMFIWMNVHRPTDSSEERMRIGSLVPKKRSLYTKCSGKCRYFHSEMKEASRFQSCQQQPIKKIIEEKRAQRDT